MTLRPSRTHATKRWLGLLLVVGAFSALALNAAIGHSGVNSIPGNFFRVEDQQGANDVPGQVDLTQMGRDDSVATTYKLFWSWDSTDSWTGTGQTGDACALFDTDGDGFINFVTCVRVENPGADPTVVKIVPSPSGGPVYLFSCSDKKNDRCTNPAAVGYTAGQASAGQIGGSPLDPAANLITDTDPFPSVGANTPHDSTVEVQILTSLIPGTTEVLVNVCSYPSAGNGGNNNPFDCIVTPGTGFLKIVKSAGTTTTSFAFVISPAPEPPDSANQTIIGSGSTSELVMLIGSTYSVTETVPSGWTLSSSGCTIAGGGSTGTGTNPVTAITVSSGKVTTCTFTNSPILPKLTVTKVVVNDNGGTAVVSSFPLFVDAVGVTSGVQNTFAAGAHTVSETGVTGYSAVISGDCAADGTITLALADVKACTITNDDDAPSLTLAKVVTNDNGGTALASAWTLTASGPSGFSGAGPSVSNGASFDAGSYDLSESGPAGYTASAWACVGGTQDDSDTITVALGESATCTITNDDTPAEPTGETVQSWILHDELFITGIRHGADVPLIEADATVTFRLFAACDMTTGIGSGQVGSNEVINLLLGDSAETVNGVAVDDSGTYYWTATYSGDAWNVGFTTPCYDEITQILAKDAKDGGRDDFLIPNAILYRFTDLY